MPSSRPAVTTFAFHIHAWKRPVMEAYFPDRVFCFLPFYLTDRQFRTRWAPRILQSDNPEFLVWSLNVPQAALDFAREHAIPIRYVEDGFIRSLHASAGYNAPLSLTLDSQTPYFDSRSRSDLEDLLNACDFDADPDLIERSKRAIASLLESRISKYNARKVGQDSADTGRKSVLVMGQVEDDASIRFGCDRPFTNNDLVRLAHRENPGREILYRPHPDVLNGVRRHRSDPADVAHLCHILTAPMPLADILETTDHVYTITSLSGFEAVLRNIKVTVAGAPFYAGWGLTDDRQATPRRGRQLSKEAVFAAAYLLYPRYFDIRTGAPSTFEHSLATLTAWRNGTLTDETWQGGITCDPSVRWKAWSAYGLFGWRFLYTPLVAAAVARLSTAEDAAHYKRNPIAFFREIPDRRYRRIGRFLYPFGEG